MKTLIEKMKDVGANDTSINLLLSLFIIFVFFVGVGSASIAFYQAVIGVTVSPFLLTIVGSLVGVVTTLVVSNHQTAAINGTATTTAKNTIDSMQPSIAANAAMTERIVEALMSSQFKTAQQTADISSARVLASKPIEGTIQENTVAVVENTAATTENTQEKTK